MLFDWHWLDLKQRCDTEREREMHLLCVSPARSMFICIVNVFHLYLSLSLPRCWIMFPIIVSIQARFKHINKWCTDLLQTDQTILFSSFSISQRIKNTTFHSNSHNNEESKINYHSSLMYSYLVEFHPEIKSDRWWWWSSSSSSAFVITQSNATRIARRRSLTPFLIIIYLNRRKCIKIVHVFEWVTKQEE